MAEKKTAGQQRQRVEAALALRIAGATYEEIARALDFASAKVALRTVEMSLAASLAPGERDIARELTGRRLERLLRSVWPKAVNADSPEHLPAVKVARDLIGGYARLYGLEAPTEIVVHSPTTAELESWIAQVLAAGVPTVIEADVLEDDLNDVDGPKEIGA